MSLSNHRDDIESIVAGTAAFREEAKVREHLSTCDECRTHYDTLVLAQRALRGNMDPTADELRRERLRLEAALAPRPVAVTRTRGFPRWAFLLLPAAAAAALVLLTTLPPRDTTQVTERGGDETQAPFTVSLYAKAKSGNAPLRLAGEFPSSGEATVSASEWLQIVSQTSATTIAVGTSGTQVFAPGESVSLAPGRWRVFAVSGASFIEVVTAAKAVSPQDKRLPLAKPQVTGVLSVQP